MFKRISGIPLLDYSLMLCAFSLPVSNFLISISLIGLVAAILFSENKKERFKIVFSNKSIWAFCIIFIVHILGLWNTENFEYAFHDLNIKLPLLILPVAISYFGINELLRKKVIISFITGVCIAVIVGIILKSGLTGKVITDTRQLSAFISHIRLSLMICIAIIFLTYLMSKKDFSVSSGLILVLIFSWFLFELSALSGILAFILLSCFYFLKLLLSIKKKQWRFLWFSLLLFSCVLFSVKLIQIVKTHYSINEAEKQTLDSLTASGGIYGHITEDLSRENGYLVGRYLCKDEYEREWNKRSKIDIKGLDEKGQYIEYTLIRYLTSKGLRKDSAGVSKLNDLDIRNIEMGIPNYKYADASNFTLRIHEILYEFDNFKNGGKPDGHSIVMRLTFWKTAFQIIKENFVFGVGTGDVNDAFLLNYKKNKVSLSEKYWFRAHNQFLTFWVSFGAIGFSAILFCILFILNHPNKHPLFYAVMFVLLFSFLSEDTLETSAGATLYGLFSILFYNHSLKKQEEKN